MKRTRLLLAATCLLAAASALPASAAGDDAEATVLTATTVVETRSSGSTEVLLPAGARLSAAVERNPDVRLTGRGRLVGIWLEPVAGAEGFLGSYRLPAFAGGKQLTYGSTGSSCRPTSATLPLGSDCTSPAGSLELGRGLYRLTVLADDAPLRITLRLDGLRSGTTRVPLERLASAQKPLPVRETVGTSLVTFGGSTDLGGPVQTLTVVTARPASAGGPATVQEASSCRRTGTTAPPFGYGPHCPGGTSGGYAYGAQVGPEGTSGAGAFASSDEGTGAVGLGGSFGDSRGVVFGEALGVWLARS